MVSTLTFSDISQFLNQYQSLIIDGPVDFLSNIKQYQDDDYYMLNLIIESAIYTYMSFM